MLDGTNDMTIFSFAIHTKWLDNHLYVSHSVSYSSFLDEEKHNMALSQCY